MIPLLEILPTQYILDGIIGGALYILVQKYGFADKAEILRRLGIGAIAGYVVYIAGLPNSFTALGLGYMGIDAIEALITTISKTKTKIKEV